MSVYDKVTGQPQMNLQQIKQDPIGMAKKAGYEIPQNLSEDPQVMFQYLVQSGQLFGQKLQQAMRMKLRMGLK